MRRALPDPDFGYTPIAFDGAASYEYLFSTFRHKGKRMVLWCKGCGAYLGLRAPFEDWTTDRNALCKHCAPEHFDLGPIVAEIKPDAKEGTSETPLPKDD